MGKDIPKPCPFREAFLFLILAVSPVMGQEGMPALIEKVEPSIVVIMTYSKDGNMLGQETGFFINQEGDVVTNSHVLQGASRAVIKATDESYKKALRITSKEVGIHSNLCATYGRVGRFEEAVESCKQATQLKSDFAESHNNLGWSYQRLGRYQEAIQSCKEAIRLKPDFAQAHYNLGNSYSALKKYKEAIDSYKQTLRLRPSLAEAHLNLGMSYLRLGDRGSAIEEYKILRELNQELANKLFNLIYE